MCGICGFVFRRHRPSQGELSHVATGMADALIHRGPDDSGVWTDTRTGVALAHRRLSILDLSAAGRQPMTSPDGRLVISYNGEVYNYLDLRKELTRLGHRFRGHSDTEVVLAAITEWDVSPALSRMNGMFAFGLWDVAERTLTLARDRVGKKPLYYGWCGDVFMFGSELKALRAHPNFDSKLDLDALGLFMQHAFLPTPYSIYKNIRKLPSGTTLSFKPHSDPGGDSPQAYWSAKRVAEDGEREPFAGTYEEATDALDTLLTDAVGKRMIADVELGALLSGGIDSTTVVSMMQVQSNRPVKTFSIGFHEASHNEAEHARGIARHLGTDHTELYVTPQESMALVTELPTIYDEPFADPSQIPTLIVSRLAHKDVKVVLSGDGGDELFAGYSRYSRRLRHWEEWKHWPHVLRHGTACTLRGASRVSWRLFGPRHLEEHKGFSKWRRFGAKLDKLAWRIDARNAQDLFARTRSRYYNPAEIVPGSQPVPTVFSDRGQWVSVAEPMQAMMHMDLVGSLADYILVKVDRASMATSLEARCPMLDHRVVDFAWHLPISMRVGEHGGKRILRQVLGRYVPPELTERPKMGFGVPVGAWVRGPLRDWAESLLDEKSLRERGYLRPSAVRQIWQQHLSGWRDHDNLLWSILMFQAWCDSA